MKKGTILGAVVASGLMIAGVVFCQESGSTVQPQPQAQPGVQVPAQKVIRLHTVKAGENLHLLAGYYYGDARQWKKIWELNKKDVRNPNIISVGQVLKVEVPQGWQPKFDLEKYMAESAGRIPGVKAVQRKPTIVKEKEEVKSTFVPRLLEEAPAKTKPETTTSPETTSESSPK